MFYSLLNLSKKFNKKWLLIALISGILSVLSYTASRFFIIIIPILFLILSINRIKKKIEFNVAILITIIVFVFIGITYSFFGSIDRFNQISIFSSSTTDLIMNEQIREDQSTSVLITRTFHNKIINYSRTSFDNYGEYFSLNFLFMHGGLPSRVNIPESGLFYLWQLPFLLIGSYFLVKKNKKISFLIFGWWLLLLVPVAFTFDEIPNVYRALVILPAMLIIISFGIYEFFISRWIKGRIGKILIILLLLIGIYELVYFSHQYFVHQEKHKPWYREYAYKELIKELNIYYPKYKKIVISKSIGSPYIHILFNNKYDPHKYQSLGSPRDLDYSGFDKYYFVPMDCVLYGTENEDPNGILFVDYGTCKTPTKAARILKSINWKDGTPAFRLMEYYAKVTFENKTD